MTESRIDAIRQRLSDPAYMDRAISRMADDLVHDMFRGDGSDEPHFQDTGRAPVHETE
jgi:hypothetical protein